MAKYNDVPRNARGQYLLDCSERLKQIDEDSVIMVDSTDDRVQIVTIKDYVYEKGVEHAVIRNVGRDLSHAYDGMNFVERRIVWTMFKEKYFHTRPKVKGTMVVGSAMANWYPHGDMAIVKTIWRLGRPCSNTISYIDKQGGYGNVDTKKGSAARYIELRLSKYSDDCFFSEMTDRSSIVDMRDNYKFSDKEPIYLPTKYPNALFHWKNGIGYGASMNIPGFNIGEVLAATIKLIDDPAAKINIYPDTPNDILITNKSELKGCFDRNTFKIQLRGKYTVGVESDVVNGRKYDKHVLVFTSIPHTTEANSIKEKMVEALREGSKNQTLAKRFKEIKDINVQPIEDTGLNFIIEYEKGYDPHVLAEKLYKSFDFGASVGALYSMIKDNNIIKYTPRQLLLEWIEIRLDQKRRYLIQKIQDVMLDKITAEAFLKVIAMDKNLLTNLATDSKNRNTYIKELQDKFNFSELEATVLSAVKSYEYTKEHIKNVERRVKELIQEYSKLRTLLSSEDDIKEEIKRELQEGITKYGIKRKSTLIDLESTGSDPEETKVIITNRSHYFGAENIPSLCTFYDKFDNSFDLIELKNKDTVLTINEDGFIKQLDGFAFNITADPIGLSNLGVSKNVKTIALTNKVKYICLITEGGYAKLLEVDECTKATKTRAFNLLNKDKIVDAIPLNNLKGCITMMTEDKMYYLPVSGIPIQKRGAGGAKVIKEDGLSFKRIGFMSDDAQYLLMVGSFGYTKCINRSYLQYNKKIDNCINFSGKVLHDVVALGEKGKIRFIYELGENIRFYEVKDGEVRINFIDMDGNLERDEPILMKLGSSISGPEKTFPNSKNEFFRLITA